MTAPLPERAGLPEAEAVTGTHPIYDSKLLINECPLCGSTLCQAGSRMICPSCGIAALEDSRAVEFAAEAAFASLRSENTRLAAELAAAKDVARWDMAHDIVAKVEARRMRILTDRTDPSYTGHFAEIENEIIEMVPGYWHPLALAPAAVSETGAGNGTEGE